MEQARVDEAKRRPLGPVVSKHVRLKRNGRELKGLCPFHKEKTPSFGVVESEGFYHCFGCGAHGDVISFVMTIERLSFVEAVNRLLDDAARGDDAATMPATAAPEPADMARVAKAMKVWDGCRPLHGTPAEAYLKDARGITLDPWPDSLAYHPSLEYWHDPGDGRNVLYGRYQGLVAKIDDVDGNFMGVWRIFLADVPIRKRGLGISAGGAVRFGTPADELGIGEGIESTAAALQLTGGLIPFWAALSTSGIRSLELPDIVKHPVIFADNDQPLKNPNGSYRRAGGKLICPGQDAAEAACARWHLEGRFPQIQLPLRKDFNDVLRGRLESFEQD